MYNTLILTLFLLVMWTVCVHVHCTYILQPYTDSDIHVHVFNPFAGSDSQARCVAQLSGANAELSKVRGESAALISQVKALTAEKKVWLCVCVHSSHPPYSVVCYACD